MHPSRREFIRTGAVVTGGLVIAFTIPGGRRLAFGQPAPGDSSPFAPNAFLRVGTDDTVTVLLSHSEMGQGVWTTLPMLIAEELDADWSRIRVEHAPAAPAYLHTAYGMQMTGGSSSTWSEFDRYRQAGALARALLVQAAAQRFGASPADCRTENGAVIAGARHARYGELADAAAKLPAPKKVPLKDPKDWKVIGKPTRRLDTPEKITGRATFGMDVHFDGLLTAVVARWPVFGARVKSFDATKARAVPGVRDVVQVPTGVAVLADHFWAAKLGRDALAVEWDLGPGATLDSDTLRKEFVHLAATRGCPPPAPATPASPSAGPRKTLEAEYFVPYLAHAHDGAAQLHRAALGRQVRDLVGHPVPDDGSAARGQDHRAQAGADRGPHDLPRRRVRAASQPDLRLRQRGGAGRQGERPAGQGGVDPGGRNPRRVLSAVVRSPGPDRARRRRACRWRGSTPWQDSRSSPAHSSSR